MTPEEWQHLLSAANHDRREAALYGVILGVSAMALVSLVALAVLAVTR